MKLETVKVTGINKKETARKEVHGCQKGLYTGRMKTNKLLCCDDCSCEEPMQPCEACENNQR